MPVGIALFPKENPVTGPREWAEVAHNITRWTKMPRGGHFPAAEEPELLATELREFFRPCGSSPTRSYPPQRGPHALTPASRISPDPLHLQVCAHTLDQSHRLFGSK